MQNANIASIIKSLCHSKGISISLLLQKCTLTKSFIYDLEKRHTSPSCEKISKIADYLDCSVDYLLGRTDVPEVNRGEIYYEESVQLAALNKGSESFKTPVSPAEANELIDKL